MAAAFGPGAVPPPTPEEHLLLLCSSLGVDAGPSVNQLDTICELMNFSLQCLGSLRLLFHRLEKQRRAEQLLSLHSANALRDVGEGYWAVKSAFSCAVQRYLKHICTACDGNGDGDGDAEHEPHNLDPARHILEAFPNSASMGSKEWLAAHWATLGDPAEHSFSIDNSNNSTQKPQQSCGAVHSNAEAATDSRIFTLDCLGNVLPDCFKEVDKEGRSVLHIAARLDSVPLFEAALSNCRKYHGRSVDEPNLNGAFPLHNAARFCNHAAVYERVRAEYPAAIEMVNNDEMLPLHWAAVKNRNASIVKDLMERYPLGVQRPNLEGYLPLHCAGQNNCLSTVKLIYDANPTAIAVPDLEGGLPFHHACCFKDNFEVAKFICEAYPDAITIPQQDGITPIHLAASQNDSVELLRYIINKCPQAATIKDDEGWLPIDCLLDTIDKRISARLLGCLRYLVKFSPTITSSKRPLIMNAVSRIILNRNPSADVVLYRTLNWIARKQGIWILINLASEDHNFRLEESEKALRNQYSIEYLSNFKKFSTVSKEEYVEKHVAYDMVRMKHLRKLSRQFIGGYQLAIPSGILQKIIKML